MLNFPWGLNGNPCEILHKIFIPHIKTPWSLREIPWTFHVVSVVKLGPICRANPRIFSREIPRIPVENFTCLFPGENSMSTKSWPLFWTIAKWLPTHIFIVVVLILWRRIYGSECFPVSKSQFNSLEFALRGSFMKIFNTRSKEIANYCMETFNVQNPHYNITKRKCKFLSNIMSSKNALCELCREFAEKELELCAHPSNWTVNVAQLSHHLFNLFNFCLIMYVWCCLCYHMCGEIKLCVYTRWTWRTPHWTHWTLCARHHDRHNVGHGVRSLTTDVHSSRCRSLPSPCRHTLAFLLDSEVERLGTLLTESMPTTTNCDRHSAPCDQSPPSSPQNILPTASAG